MKYYDYFSEKKKDGRRKRKPVYLCLCVYKHSKREKQNDKNGIVLVP